MKRFLCVFFSSILLILFVNSSVTVSLAYINYSKNLETLKTSPIEGAINSQFSYPQFKFGFGDVSHNGCGAVAIYNLMYLDGKNPNFAEIIKSMDLFGTFSFGVLGSIPTAVNNYLIRSGYNVKSYKDETVFEEVSKNCKYCILNYWSFHGGHFQLMYDYKSSDNTLKIINPTKRESMNSQLSKLKSYPYKTLYVIN